MGRKTRKAKEEKAQRLLMWKYRTDPLYWLEHRLGEDPKQFLWSLHEGNYLDHVWDGHKDPIASAWRAVADVYKQIDKGKIPTHRKVGIQSCTGSSKTYWLARLAVWFLDVYDDSLIVTTAPKEDQLKLLLWAEIGKIAHKLKKIRPASHLYKLRLLADNSGVDIWEGSADFDEELKDAWQAVGFVSGAGTEEESAGRARGFHREHMLIILEECTGVRLPVITAFKNTCTGMHNVIVAVGNPDNEFDALNAICIMEDCKAFRISAYDYPNVVLQKEIYPGAVTQISIDTMLKDYGENSQMFKAMGRGICPTQAVDSLIKLEWLEQCIDLEVAEEFDSYNAVGVDVAASKAGDKAALAWGQGSTLVALQEFQCPNPTHLGYNLIMTDLELQEAGYTSYHTNTCANMNIFGDCIGVDAVGVGVATVNVLADQGIEVQALQGGQWLEAINKDPSTDKPLFNFISLRAQMWWEAREDLRLMRVSIKLEDQLQYEALRKELCSPKFEASANSIKVESKKHITKRIGKSPNIGDAFVYWNWVRKGYRLTRYGDMPFSSGA